MFSPFQLFIHPSHCRSRSQRELSTAPGTQTDTVMEVAGGWSCLTQHSPLRQGSGSPNPCTCCYGVNGPDRWCFDEEAKAGSQPGAHTLGSLCTCCLTIQFGLKTQEAERLSAASVKLGGGSAVWCREPYLIMLSRYPVLVQPV